MSDLISDQINELRETADRLDRIANVNVSTPWIHAKLTPMLREAADAIDSLSKQMAKCQDCVVLCRNCTHSLSGGDGCGRWGDVITVEPLGFCAWGERKEIDE